MRWLPILFILSACSLVQPEAVRQLSRLDPLTANPGDITVFLELPQGIAIQPDGLRLALAVENPDKGSAAGEWPLQETKGPDGRRQYQIAPDQLEDVRQVQATAAAWEAEAPEATEGSLGVSVDPCRVPGTERAVRPTLSVALALTPGGAPMPLFEDAPISRFLSGQDVDALPACRT
ncbi:MAG: hypothetical protein ACU0GG_21135 [Paracoccaceae bacterium]